MQLVCKVRPVNTRTRLPRRRPKLGAAALVVATLASAQERDGNDELAAKATDPTASLMSFQLYDWYTPSYRDVDGSTNQIVLRAAIPFSLAGTSQIFRITQPYVTSSVGGTTAFADTTLFDLMVFSQPWGRWGVGIAATLPTGSSGLTTDKWTAGPAVGFVNSRPTSGSTGALFAQTFFSFAGKSSADDVGIVNLQPIFSLPLGQGRSLSLGNSALIYDTSKSRWASLLLSANYGQVVELRRLQVASERRGRLRLPEHLRHAKVDRPGRRRVAVAHPLMPVKTSLHVSTE